MNLLDVDRHTLAQLEEVGRRTMRDLVSLFTAWRMCRTARSVPEALQVVGVPHVDVVNVAGLDAAAEDVGRRVRDLAARLRSAGEVPIAMAIDEAMTLGLDDSTIAQLVGMTAADVARIRQATTQ